MLRVTVSDPASKVTDEATAAKSDPPLAVPPRLKFTVSGADRSPLRVKVKARPDARWRVRVKMTCPASPLASRVTSCPVLTLTTAAGGGGGGGGGGWMLTATTNEPRLPLGTQSQFTSATWLTGMLMVY